MLAYYKGYKNKVWNYSDFDKCLNGNQGFQELFYLGGEESDRQGTKFPKYRLCAVRY